MKLIFSITILFLLSCKLNDKNSPRSSTQKLDLLDSQNYTEDFEIINDWFITSQFCKKNSESNEMEFSATVYFKYADELKWKRNKHWYKNSDYEVKIDDKRLVDHDNSFLYKNFEMWSSVISHEYFLNDAQSDNSCFDVKENIIYKIYRHQAQDNKWEFINETTDKEYLETLILKKSKELDDIYNKKVVSLDLIELESNKLVGEFGAGTCENSDVKLINHKSTTYIDFFAEEGKGIDARILVSAFLNKDSNQNTYYYKYKMLTGITRFNKALDWGNLSQDSIIAKVTRIGNNQLKLKWLGFYDNAKRKRVDLKSHLNQFLGLSNSFQLNKCP